MTKKELIKMFKNARGKAWTKFLDAERGSDNEKRALLCNDIFGYLEDALTE